jgi:hypothetical protein
MATGLRRSWLLFPLYLVGGFCLGLADERLGAVARSYGMRPGVATAVVVNLVLPVVALGLAAVAPSYARVVLGALAMTFAYLMGLALAHPVHGWDAAALLRAIKPVHVLACVGYVVVGVIGRRWTARLWPTRSPARC